MWGSVEAAEDAGEGGFDEGSRGRRPTGTILQFLWFLGHMRWILSFLSSSRSLADDEKDNESAQVVQPTHRTEPEPASQPARREARDERE